VGTPLLLFCEVIQREMGLSNGRVYLWDQKLNQPTDSGLYIAVAVVNCKPFANVNRQSTSGTQSEQFVSMLALLDINIISRSAAARDRKEEIILALNSIYAQQQQEANSFYIAKLSPLAGFVNLSEVDGAAIPYRYKISVNIQYAYKKTSALQYFENFTDTIYTDT
jgi:GGDEF domain-containing protein